MNEENDVLRSLFEEQHRWSRAASAAKTRINRWRQISLGLTIVGAILITAATQIDQDTFSQILAIMGGTSVAAAPIVTTERLSHATLTTWARLRSVSEGLKSDGYLFLTSTNPYDGPDRVARLIARKSAILHPAANLEVLANRVVLINVSIPPVHDVASYIEHRIRPQIAPPDGYYPANADREQRALDRANLARFVLSLVAGLLGVVAGATGSKDLTAWVLVITTVIGAIFADTAARRHETNVLEYTRTLRRLEWLTERWGVARSSGRDGVGLDAQYVLDCEDAISSENKAWMAAFDTQAPTKQE